MTALAEKMKVAGVDTIGAKLTAACTEAIRLSPEKPVDAWLIVYNKFGREFLQGLMADMGMANRAPTQSVQQMRNDSSGQYERGVGVVNREVPSIAEPRPYQPRVIPPERLEKRRQLQEIVRSKFKTSDGRHWSDVTPHEAIAMGRDGAEASALLAALPAGVPNDGRSFGEHLGLKRVDEIIARVRG